MQALGRSGRSLRIMFLLPSKTWAGGRVGYAGGGRGTKGSESEDF